ncbi:orotidine-5'-phosphate decarboxylase [Atopobacter sp. AH10]|uniref:orotidine-5'-phosphate decarboxylase n=1 Tax=Atopobacter sp. AH10 TaxID=2315861 RepID=UPI000EF20ECE|nr:orotidine-5'-phosphate decarboxylase [Atopobacter sp. AH10]RLK62983.1 orotidine-5'-phosphate decarboxylase [Atopobacter sp. AH10]
MQDLFIALDFHREEELWDFLKPFKGERLALKIGMSQFYMSGPDIVKRLSEEGHKIFLDLKCHDIPNTVYLALYQLSHLPVDIVTVHALGGSEMLKAAVKGSQEGPFRPDVFAITQLTSTNQTCLNEELAIPGSVAESVSHLTELALSSGIHGVVSSVREVPEIKKLSDGKLKSLTPGIRLASSVKDDQARVSTPEEARQAGSDFIVVGRPITQSADPLNTYHAFLKAFKGEK